MMTKASLPWDGWFWLGVVLLPLALCLGVSALFVAAQDRLADADLPTGVLAGVCVEWGTNWAGRTQVGVWWESHHLGVEKPGVPPVRSLHIHCGIVPWSPALPTRGTFIYTR